MCFCHPERYSDCPAPSAAAVYMVQGLLDMTILAISYFLKVGSYGVSKSNTGVLVSCCHAGAYLCDVQAAFSACMHRILNLCMQ